MNVYIWEDVLVDYTAGMMVVVAHNKKEALAVLEKAHGTPCVEEARSVKPTVIRKTRKTPVSFICYGGG